MAKRRTKRKITIRFIGRDPNDSLRIFDEVERAFKPQEIEITVENVKLETPQANEELETKSREAVAQTLEDKDKAVAQENEAVRHAGSTDDDTIVGKATEKKTGMVQWMKAAIPKGWSIFASIVKVLKDVKDFLGYQIPQ
jgi:hypothetical protein